ncbi:hypothetical protein E2C01_007025 [Portunus trituberculatus]|uniref:Uncharacterized protein n=1 Tax=Portunus trituberculatus TaxID=210409 RepID=A0A5B7CX05_PORTR|nr:hypothetical protein [Portunus trituberculatus]
MAPRSGHAGGHAKPTGKGKRGRREGGAYSEAVLRRNVPTATSRPHGSSDKAGSTKLYYVSSSARTINFTAGRFTTRPKKVGDPR